MALPRSACYNVACSHEPQEYLIVFYCSMVSAELSAFRRQLYGNLHAEHGTLTNSDCFLLHISLICAHLDGKTLR